MGSNRPQNNRIDQTTAEQTLIDGFNKHAAEIPTMVINGAVQTTKDLVATLQSRIDSAKAALSARATWQTAIRTDEARRETTKTYVSGVKQGLLVAFAGQLDTLADFGLTARAKHVATPEAKIAAAAKAKATRAARHTMGKKQKAEIKGTVTPTAPATAAPSAPAPAPTPPAILPTTAVTPMAPPALPVALPATTSPRVPLVAPPIAATPSPVPPAVALTAPTSPPVTPASTPEPTHTA